MTYTVDDLFLQIEVKHLGETDASFALIACIPGKFVALDDPPIWAILKITSSARASSVAGISMSSALAVSSGVGNPVLNYRELSFGPNCAFRFNCQRGVRRGQASYVVAVTAPSDFAQL
jgi:hypothetical protein